LFRRFPSNIDDTTTDDDITYRNDLKSRPYFIPVSYESHFSCDFIRHHITCLELLTEFAVGPTIIVTKFK